MQAISASRDLDQCAQRGQGEAPPTRVAGLVYGIPANHRTPAASPVATAPASSPSGHPLT